MTILLWSYILDLFLNIAIEGDLRINLGWAMIVTCSLNIFIMVIDLAFVVIKAIIKAYSDYKAEKKAIDMEKK